MIRQIVYCLGLELDNCTCYLTKERAEEEFMKDYEELKLRDPEYAEKLLKRRHFIELEIED